MKFQNKTYISFSLFIFCLFILFQQQSNAQLPAPNNTTQLKDYLEKCLMATKNSKVISMTDTLIARAQKVGNSDIIARAIQARAEYYYNSKQLNNLIKEKEKMVRLFSGKAQEDEIFALWNRVIDFYLYKNNSQQAINEIKEYQQEAIELNNIYGQGYAYLKSGDVYFHHSDYKISVEQYKKGLEYFNHKNIHKYDDEFNLYLSSAYFNMEQYKESKEYATKLIEKSKKRPSIIAQIALCNAKLGLTSETYTWIKEFEGMMKDYPLSRSTLNNYHITLNIYYNLIGKYDEAIKHAMQISKESLKIMYLKETYKNMGNFSEALKYSERSKELQDSLSTSESTEQLAHFASQYDANRLRMERNELELRNTQLSLKQLNDERNLALSLNSQKELELSNKNLLIKQQESDIEKQNAISARNIAEAKIMQERLNSERRDHNLLWIGTIFIFIVLWGQTMLLIRTRKQKKEKEKAYTEANKAKLLAEQVKKEAQEAQIRAEIAQKDAENADQMKSLFLQNMSHEIRTPLNAIVGFTTMLNDPEMEFSAEEKVEFLNLVQENSEQLTTLVNDLLDISKLESGTYKIQINDEGVEHICQSTLSSVLGKEMKGVEMKMISPSNQEKCIDGRLVKDIVIHTDIVRVKQVLTNFLTNACKYTEKGTITLTYFVREAKILDSQEEIVFSVSDTGCGISKENAELIFERFEKLGSFKKGTGLGLNICSRIADLLKGKVMLDTEYTNGSRFLFILPL